MIRAVLVQIAGEPYAFPHNRIDGLVRIDGGDLRSLADRQYFELDGENVGIGPRPTGARFAVRRGSGDDVCVVLFSNRGRRYGLIVDRFHGEQDLVVRPLDARLGKVPNVSAAAILDDGSPVLIVDLDDLHRSIERLLHEGHLRRAGRAAGQHAAAQTNPGGRRLDHGPRGRTATAVQPRLRGRNGRGRDRGLERGPRRPIRLVVTDIDMPRMNGIELVHRMKAEPRLQSIPVVIVSYKDRQEDRRQGLDAGANFYLTKSSFHDETLIEAVQELIGRA